MLARAQWEQERLPYYVDAEETLEHYEYSPDNKKHHHNGWERRRERYEADNPVQKTYEDNGDYER